MAQNFPKALLFDLDGTLADTVGDIRHALNMALSLKGVAPFDETAVRGMVGAGAIKLIVRAMLAAEMTPNTFDAQYLKAAFVAAYNAKPCEEAVLYPGVFEALQTLRQAGCMCAVVSNKPHELTCKVVEGLGLTDHFNVILGGSDDVPLKPAPAMLNASAGIMGLKPEDIVMVGDSDNDVEAARAAGCPVVVVDYGYSDIPAVDLGADAVISNFSELPKVLAALS